MLDSIALKCSNCGANLQITPEMETFACGYCGASQMVQRTGGTVSLKLLSEGISKVQAGTDKTAAELAIRRLTEEYQSLEISYNDLESTRWSKEFAMRKPYTWGWLGLSFFCFITFIGNAGSAGGALILCLVWIVCSGLLIYFYLKQSSKNKYLYEAARQSVFAQMQETVTRINENKKIIGY